MIGGGMRGAEICNIKAREILDSKGRPMVEVDVITNDGFVGRGSAPCGTSVGSHEAFILRDNEKRFQGLGVRKAVQNIHDIIAPLLIGRNVFDQRIIDEMMISCDGTTNKTRLGANAIYSISIAVARAAAMTAQQPLFKYVGGISACRLPVPIFNMVHGGTYVGAQVEFQEFSMIPMNARSYSEAVMIGFEILHELACTIEERLGKKFLLTGMSGAYVAPMSDPAGIIELILEAALRAGYRDKVGIHLDCAASHFYDVSHQCYRFQGKEIGRPELIGFYAKLSRYPLLIIEDPFHEDDYEGFSLLSERINAIVAGDDLFVTNINRLKEGIRLHAANAIIFKPNQAGSLSEALDAADLARQRGLLIIPSSRVGGPVDDPIPELAVATGAPLAKFGPPRTGERTSYHNMLLRIEEELGSAARFAQTNLARDEKCLNQDSLPTPGKHGGSSTPKP
jgi:enolase